MKVADEADRVFKVPGVHSVLRMHPGRRLRRVLKVVRAAKMLQPDETVRVVQDAVKGAKRLP